MIISVAFSPDGQLLATSSFDGWARVWEIASGEERLNLSHGFGSARFSPDGRYLANANVTEQITLMRPSLRTVTNQVTLRTGDSLPHNHRQIVLWPTQRGQNQIEVSHFWRRADHRAG